MTYNQESYEANIEVANKTYQVSLGEYYQRDPFENALVFLQPFSPMYAHKFED
jgi:hypothetical protein